MPITDRRETKERPWGLYLLLSVVLLFCVYGVSQYLYPIVDAPEDREELGIDRVRAMIEEEKRLGLYEDHQPHYPDSSRPSTSSTQ